MEKEQKQLLLRLCAAAVLSVAAWLAPFTGVPKALCWLVPYLAAGYEVLWDALKGLLHGELLDEDFLMSAATVGAIVLGEYPEAVLVMILFGVGELFEEIAEGRSRRSITALMDTRPDTATVRRGGVLTEVPAAEIAVDEIMVIRPGDRIALDGEIIEGMSTLDTAALTGEALPREAAAGDAVLSGCVNLSGLLYVRVTKPYGESAMAKILELVENSGEHAGKSEKFITRFAAVYTPCVIAAAALLAIVPSLISGAWGVWVHRALVFLVASCPCALVISVPLAYFGGIGGASRHGILVKGGKYLDALGRCEIAAFDKTGTLTRGSFAVSAVYPADGHTAEELLETAALAEQWSAHPIARSLRAAWGRTPDAARCENAEELAGRGIRATVDGREVLVGNAKLMAEQGVACTAPADAGTVVYASADGQLLGSVVISDEVKTDAKATLDALKARGVKKTVLLTGDRRESAQAVGAQLGVDELRAELLPGDKAAELERLRGELSQRGTLVFAGDGINDAPVLQRADVGVAMGALGTDAAIEAADVVLTDDAPGKLAAAVDIARRTKRIVTENIVFAIGVKLLVLALAALGHAGMWLASFADVGVCVIAVANAARAVKTPPQRFDR